MWVCTAAAACACVKELTSSLMPNLHHRKYLSGSSKDAYIMKCGRRTAKGRKKEKMRVSVA